MNLYRLVEKFVYKPETVTSIGEVRKLLKNFGYRERRKQGSECIFHKKGASAINVPTVRGRGVKSFYVKRIVKFLNLEEWLELRGGYEGARNAKERDQKNKGG